MTFPRDSETSSNWMIAFISLAASAVLLLSYPLYVDFPVSHEVPQYIIGSLKVRYAFSESLTNGVVALLTNSWYPASIALLTVADIITPLSWPDLIILLSVVVHLVIGIVLGVLSERIHSRIAGALTLIIWSATFTVMRPIVNGWMAEWWSLLPTVVVFERALQKKYAQAAIWFVVAGLAHPLSAFVLLLTGLLTLPTYLSLERDQRKRILAVTLSALPLMIGIWWLAQKAYIFRSITDSRPVYTIIHVLSKPIAPAIIAAPIGFFWFARHYTNKFQRHLLLAFWFVSVWLTFNHLWLGSNFLEWRFEPYFLLSISVTGGIGLTLLVTTITSKRSLQLVILGVLVSLISIASWHHNTIYFKKYDGQNLLIPRTGELEAIEWLKALGPQTHILSSRSDLNYKWIPILTEHQWTGIKEGELLYEQLIIGEGRVQEKTTRSNKFTHLVIFHDRGHDASAILAAFNDYPTVYESQTTLVKLLTHHHDVE